MKTAKERYEKTWNSYLELLNKDPQASLVSFTKLKSVYYRGMIKWMSKGSGDMFLILIFLVNIQSSGKESNSSSEHVGNPVFRLLRMILLIRSRFRL